MCVDGKFTILASGFANIPTSWYITNFENNWESGFPPESKTAIVTLNLNFLPPPHWSNRNWLTANWDHDFVSITLSVLQSFLLSKFNWLLLPVPCAPSVTQSANAGLLCIWCSPFNLDECGIASQMNLNKWISSPKVLLCAWYSAASSNVNDESP